MTDLPVRAVHASTFGRWRAHPAYRHSDVEGLDEVPEGWEIRRLKTFARARPSNVDKKSIEGERPVRLCNYVDVYRNEFITDDLDFMRATASEAQVRDFGLRRGDVLATKDSESADDIAVPALVVTDQADLVCGYHLTLIRAGASASGAFIFRAMQCRAVREQFGLSANGVTRFGLPVSAFTDALFPLPPLPEQHLIAAYLDAQTTKLDTLKAKVEKAIELLKEYRTALISAAVTGKIDVRDEVPARPPERRSC